MDKLPLDAAALEELRGRTFLPGPVTTDRLVEQSRAALTLSARVAELEDENEDLFNESLKWEVHANALRDALEQLHGPCEYTSVHDPNSCLRGIGHTCRSCEDAWIISDALAQTPAASLRSRDAEVLKRAAVKCDEIVRGHSPENARVGTGRRLETKILAAGAKMCAAAIRALAAQEVTK